MFFRYLQGVRNILNGVIYDVYWNAQYIEQRFLDVHWECAIYLGELHVFGCLRGMRNILNGVI